MNWTGLDWPALDRLREGFLKGPGGGPYWRSETELASYDVTYGERIGWKWDQMLRELGMRGWTPPAGTLFDWGCGSGVASRRVMQAFGAGAFTQLQMWDHSPLAAEYSAGAARRTFPGLDVVLATPGFLASEEPVGLLVISHVLNELEPAGLDELRRLCRRARAILWVEPGTHETSRRLGAEREALLDEFRVVAPCTHPLNCPMFAQGNERHWCHFFAPPPSEIFANPDWVKFGQRAGIDLRSLPYCFMALDRSLAAGAAPESKAGLSRIIGRPEHFKPYARFLNCDADGLAELTVPKSKAGALCKELDRTKHPLVYRWRREGMTVLGGAHVSEGG